MTWARKPHARLGAALAAGLLLAGCAETPPTRFYTLSSVLAAPGETGAEAGRDLAIGIGAVTLPEYLNRPQLVTRLGSNRVGLSDFDSWIEPLQGLFARTLAENLALLLDTDDVLTLPQRRPFRPDYQVEVEVTRFDADAAGNAVLDARWWVLGARGESELHSARTTLVEPVPADDRSAAVAALSQALGALSREIADVIAAAERG
jgi:uncharacterized lipoprotein YmbA